MCSRDDNVLLGVISDIHADHLALRDALARMEQLGCTTILCAGDLVGYGRAPEETLALLREHHVACIRGNHDEWALLGEMVATPMVGEDAATFSAAVLESLSTLPRRLLTEVAGLRVAVWHARPYSDMDGIDPKQMDEASIDALLARAEADVLLVGHTHRPFALRTSRGLIANPGALMNHHQGPSDVAHTAGTFGVLELPTMDFRVFRASDGHPVSTVRKPGPRHRRRATLVAGTAEGCAHAHAAALKAD